MAESVFKCFLVGPVASFAYFAKVWMAFCQSRIKDGYFYSGPFKQLRDFFLSLSNEFQFNLLQCSRLNQLNAIPVIPIFHKASACKTEVICRGMARSNLLPV